MVVTLEQEIPRSGAPTGVVEFDPAPSDRRVTPEMRSTDQDAAG